MIASQGNVAWEEHEKFSHVEEFIENLDQSEGYRVECERMIKKLS